MQSLNSLKSGIFQIDDQNFEEHALEIFQFQYQENNLYRTFIEHLDIDPDSISSCSAIPHLPIQFFKDHVVKSGSFDAKQVFESSGTTGSTSRHEIEDLDFYRKVSQRAFERKFGPLQDSIVIGLLPSYLERGNSSLVFMVDHFIRLTGEPDSGFYLNNLDQLVERIPAIKAKGKKVYLFGVTFALLRLAEDFGADLNGITIFETGGMKGRRKELVREELHRMLRQNLNTEHVYSEYGMTELLSQAYMKGKQLFESPPWMKVTVREVYDPFSLAEPGKSGILRIADLANVHSCAFIETQDLGVMQKGGFQVLGRLDNADLRGCNLMLA